MTNEEAISHIKAMIESLEIGIKALESNKEWEGIIQNVQDPSYNSIKTELKSSGDYISKQKVLDAIDAYKYLDGNDAIYRLKQWLNEQECVQPKIGQWELDEHLDKIGMIYKYMCSECGANHSAMYDYCPSCGSYNGGDTDAASD